VQYAHARISSILREAQERGLPIPSVDSVNLELLEEADEFGLIRKLGELPEEIADAALRYEPHRMTRYAREVAAAFHVFYTNCRVLNDDNPELTSTRLALVQAAQTVLRIVLDSIGVSAPEKM
jgi:arginyl-tRNA synthetase